MNILTFANYIIFAIIITLFLLELGSSMLLLMDYKRHKKRVGSYIAPVWEITGTFSVFYLVNFVATYPGLISIVDNLYIAPALTAVILIVIRDAFLGYSELIGNKIDEKRYSLVYATCTVIIMFLIFSILSSSLTGSGVDTSSITINPASFIFNPFNILLFASVAFLVLSSSIIFFELKRPKLLLSSAILALVGFAYTIPSFAPYVYSNLLSNQYILAPTVLVLIAIVLLYLLGRKEARSLIIPFLFIAILSFEVLMYPYLFGGQLNINNYIVMPPEATYVLIVTVAGAVFLALALGLLFIIRSSQGKKKAY